MSVELLRIDDRLIHGQVVEAWVPHLNAEAVVVASAQAAADETQKTLMRMALPDTVELHVLAPAEAAALLASAVLSGKRTLVLVPSPREARELVKAGLKVPSLNVGGLHYSAGRIQLGRVIYLSDEDREDLRELVQRGIVLEGRAVPSDRRLDLASLIAA
ncbi:MAG: PTS sugar transporter subunit IIB [Elusimicrobia bacterium]|nr:PTS sugar transporter subunit IIB [Elusimicrobiota bacterium]